MVKKEYIGLTMYSKKIDRNITIYEGLSDSYYKSVGLGHILEEEKEIVKKKKKNDSDNEESE